MTRMKMGWTFGRTIATGFAAVVALTAVMALIALAGLHRAVERKDAVIDRDARQVQDVQHLVGVRDARAAANRGYLISGERRYLDDQYRYDQLFGDLIAQIRRRADTARARALLAQVSGLQAQFVTLDRAPVRLRQDGAPMSAVTAAWEAIDPQRLATADSMDTLLAYEQQLVAARKQQASTAAEGDVRLILVSFALVLLLATALAAVLTRWLRRRIADAVGDMQTSSTQLQATAADQAVGAKQQATSAGEISTTMNELLSTARQIADGAHRVGQAADEAAAAGADGRTTVAASQASMAEIRRQVDIVVERMTELSDNSQRIGLVLDMVSDLAEQTNILAINSMIEAAGAGGAGSRFGVVAEEIRRLADRVAQATREIRDLIGVVEAAAQTTRRATDAGTRAVEAGTAQAGLVVAAFEDIVTLVRTTNETAREIELSTRQQTTAMQQVNVAVETMARTTRETETGSSDTLRTATEITALSSRLRALVQAPTS